MDNAMPLWQWYILHTALHIAIIVAVTWQIYQMVRLDKRMDEFEQSRSRLREGLSKDIGRLETEVDSMVRDYAKMLSGHERILNQRLGGVENALHELQMTLLKHTEEFEVKIKKE
jgi:hypothetical protein